MWANAALAHGKDGWIVGVLFLLLALYLYDMDMNTLHCHGKDGWTDGVLIACTIYNNVENEEKKI